MGSENIREKGIEKPVSTYDGGDEGESASGQPGGTEGSAESDFARQKRLYLAIPEQERKRYWGRFVVSHNGAIMDDDSDLVELSRRFFREHGKVPVYITRIGKPVNMRSPVVKR